MNKNVINNKNIIGANLKKLRLIKEITAKSLSEKSNVSISMISQIENKKQKPAPLTLRRLVLPLEYSLCLFLSQTQDEIPEFNYDPSKIVQGKNNRILLYENKDESKMELLRPTIDQRDIAIIEINLRSDCRLFTDSLSLSGKLEGYLIKGNLLIEFSKDEQIASGGEEFQINSETAFNFRNIGNETAVLIIFTKAIYF